MMNLNIIIDAVNKTLKDDNLLILHKELNASSTFKLYKTFSYKLYLLKDHSTKCVLSYEEKKKASFDSLNDYWKEFDKIFLIKLINWITTEDFKEIYAGVQQISDTNH